MNWASMWRKVTGKDKADEPKETKGWFTVTMSDELVRLTAWKDSLNERDISNQKNLLRFDQRITLIKNAITKHERNGAICSVKQRPRFEADIADAKEELLRCEGWLGQHRKIEADIKAQKKSFPEKRFQKLLRWRSAWPHDRMRVHESSEEARKIKQGETQ